MTREEAKELLSIIQAFAAGKIVQVKGPDNRWHDYSRKDCKLKFDSDPQKYRIKPEPKYRPFKNKEECWQEMLKHQPFGWVKRKGNKPSYELLACISENNEALVCFASYGSADSGVVIRSGGKFDNIFNGFTFADGTPFGVKVEE